MSFDIVIHNGRLITVNSKFDIIDNGIICVKDTKIEKITKSESAKPLPTAKLSIDAKGGLILPGLVNTHTHLPMTLFRGLADDLALDEWLNNYIFPAEKRYINKESVRLGSLLGCAEMLSFGITTCCDGYFIEDEVANAVLNAGLRAVLGHGVIDFPAPGITDPKDNIKYANKFIEKWIDRSPLITPSIFCHSPYTCSSETLKRAKRIAAEKGLIFQIHAAETRQEMEGIKARHGVTPIAYLDKLDVLDKNTLLVHTLWIDDNDINIITRKKANVSHNPESNMKLASGILPLVELLDAGIVVGLGTDGSASNNNLNLFETMNVTSKIHKVKNLNPTLIDAAMVLKMATIDGARALGMDNKIGSLEPGKQADIIIIDTRQPHLVPLYNPVSHLIYAARGSDVKDVLVAGKVVVRNKKLLTIDIENLQDTVNLMADKIDVTLP